MNRRAFLAGTTSAVVLPTGCIANQPSGSDADTKTDSSSEPTTTVTGPPTKSTPDTSGSTRRAERACNGVKGISFYGLETPFEDQVWGPSRVTVAFGLGAGAHVLLVVYENDRVLGMARTKAPGDGGVAVDGQPIQLNTELSGKHTIRVVMYGDTNRDGQFDPETAMPCRHEGNVVRTESETIDFSRFSDSTATPKASG